MILRQTPDGFALVSLVLDNKPSDLSEIFAEIQQGKKYTCDIKPKRKTKSDEQRACIWAKISQIADAIQASKEEVYEECLKRYGQGMWIRINKDDLPEIARNFRLISIQKDYGDSVTLLAYKGLSEMDSTEASKLLDGVLSECREIGISDAVERN